MYGNNIKKNLIPTGLSFGHLLYKLDRLGFELGARDTKMNGYCSCPQGVLPTGGGKKKWPSKWTITIQYCEYKGALRSFHCGSFTANCCEKYLWSIKPIANMHKYKTFWNVNYCYYIVVIF